MDNKTCDTCKQFRQHYVKRNGNYFQTDHGHCTHRIRGKMPRNTDSACKHYQSNIHMVKPVKRRILQVKDFFPDLEEKKS